MTEACSCTPTVSGLTPYEDALELLLCHAKPVAESETVSLEDALGRVVAEPVISRINVPGWDNSAMDGYALRAADLAASGERLVISQRVPAGVAPEPLEPGTAARIFTGAPVPEGADTVVMQEQCEAENSFVTINTDLKPGSNIRRSGEDIRESLTGRAQS